jgi:hypothetical protein
VYDPTAPAVTVIGPAVFVAEVIDVPALVLFIIDHAYVTLSGSALVIFAEYTNPVVPAQVVAGPVKSQ